MAIKEKISFSVEKSYKYPHLAALAKVAENPVYLDIFYLCGVLQEFQNLSLIEECAHLSDSLMPLWWDMFYAYPKWSEEKMRTLLAQTSWDAAFVEKIVRLYQEYIKPDFFDRLKCK